MGNLKRAKIPGYPSEEKLGPIHLKINEDSMKSTHHPSLV